VCVLRAALTIGLSIADWYVLGSTASDKLLLEYNLFSLQRQASYPLQCVFGYYEVIRLLVTYKLGNLRIVKFICFKGYAYIAILLVRYRFCHVPETYRPVAPVDVGGITSTVIMTQVTCCLLRKRKRRASSEERLPSKVHLSKASL
jgi:hypothetical protein